MMASSVTAKLGLLSLMFMSLGCAKGFKIDENIKKAIKENHESPDYTQWALSAHNPESLFESLRMEVQGGRSSASVSVELCQSLEGITDQSLLLFETQIFDSRNEEILSSCLGKLKSKLEVRHQKTRQEFKELGLKTLDEKSDDVQIAYKIIKQDMSIGARLIDGGLPHKHVALTFDDGPNPNFTPMIARALEEYGVRGHFFVVGNALRRNSYITKKVFNSGHSIGNHSITHPCMSSQQACKDIRRVGYDEAVKEITSAHRLLFDLLGAVDPIFRFPYGASTTKLREFLKQNQITEFFWNIDSLDWKSNQSNREVLNRTMARLNQSQKGILLFHDIHRRTAEMIPELLARLAQEDYTVVLISPSDETSRFRHPLLDGSYKP